MRSRLLVLLAGRSPGFAPGITRRVAAVAWIGALLAGCAPWPDPADGPGLRGPGGPNREFAPTELWKPCAWLDGGPEDVDHHNLVMPYRGHLVLPFSPEWGSGSLRFFEFDDPCAPVALPPVEIAEMRETHAIAFLHLPEDEDHAGEFAAVNGHRGIAIWDVADPAAPALAAELVLDGVGYGFDAYARVVLALTWQHPWMYVAAADNGIFVVDTLDPRNPKLVRQLKLDPPLRAGGVFALGDRLLVTSAEQTEAVVLDISVPGDPRPIPGGRFTTTDAEGNPREHYHANLYGQYAIFARKERGAGVIFVDISDPERPTQVAEAWGGDGGGGYVYGDEGRFFLGASDFGAVWDATNLAAPREIGRAQIDGDNDTLVPYGNVMVLSVDGEGTDGFASAVVPFETLPDTTPPSMLFSRPADGEQGVSPTIRIGLAFDEIVEPATVFAGSVRLETEAGRPVPFFASCQENQVHLSPKAPLEAGRTYVVSVLAGGVSDINGNTTDVDRTLTFTVQGG